MRSVNHIALRVLAAVALIVVFTGCADRKDPTDVDIAAHPAGWNDPADADFHGSYVEAVVQGNAVVGEEERRNGTEGCESCHGGVDLGRDLDEGCYECHATGNVETGGHPAAAVFLAPNDVGFHGNSFADATDIESCRTCHGFEFMGGWSDVSCVDCHTASGLLASESGHPLPNVWLAPQAAGFHGNDIIEKQSTESCAACHGADYSGGYAEVNCTACHAGGRSGHAGTGAGPWHVEQVIRDGLNSCRDCHGQDLFGPDQGWSGVSCAQAGCHEG